MAQISIAGDTSGTVTLAAPAVSGTTTLTLPTTTGNVVADTATQTLTNKTLTSPTIATPTITGQATIPTINLTGGQITFPATQSASANANTLDDYEEGTWTPTYTLGSGSATFTNQIATYTKIGKVVTIALRFAVAAASSAANLQIGGLPFAFENTNSDSSGIFRENQLTGNFYGLTFGSSTAINMFRYDNANSLPNGAPAFSGTLVYQTST